MGTAEVSLIVSGVAALGSIGAVVATYRLGRQRLEHERALADRADARSTFAAGALELGRTKGAMKEALTKFQLSLEIGSDWPHNFDEVLGNLERQIDALQFAAATIRIRLKPRDVAVAEIVAAVETMRSIAQLCLKVRAGSDLKEITPGQRWENVEELKVLIDKFDNHCDAYLAAAQRIAGVTLA
jgi:hypothetical protein